jgi:hypothetical protein
VASPKGIPRPSATISRVSSYSAASNRHIHHFLPVDVRHQYDLVPPRDERLAQAVNGDDRAAVTNGGEVGGDDVEDLHPRGIVAGRGAGRQNDSGDACVTSMCALGRTDSLTDVL